MKNNQNFKSNYFYDIWIRFKKNKLSVFGMVLFLLLIILVVITPLIVDYEEDAIKQNSNERLQPPSKTHIFGTDVFGRDVFARILYGARISLTIGITVTVMGLVLGAILGTVTAYYGGKVDLIIMRIMDVFMSIPSLIMYISLIAIFGVGMFNMIVAITISTIPSRARIIRASVLSIKDSEFVEAAKLTGCSDFRIIVRHIIPNVVGPLIINATLGLAGVMLTVASVSYMGLGIKQPTPEWGAMMSAGQKYMREVPHLIIIPGIFVFISTASLNLIGDGLQTALDPRLK